MRRFLESILSTKEFMADFILTRWQEHHAQGLYEAYTENSDLHRQMDALNSLGDATTLISAQYVVSEERAVWCIENNERPVGAIGAIYSGRAESVFDRGWIFYWNIAPLRGSGVMKHLVKQVYDWALGLPPADTPYPASVHSELLKEYLSPRLRRLELGYRDNNPASGAVAKFAGFTVEGREREKFFIDGVPVDVLTAGRLARDSAPMEQGRCVSGVHHIELWTTDFSSQYSAWLWIFDNLGWKVSSSWHNGASFQDSKSITYCVLEQSPDVEGAHHRMRAGLNHLAFSVRNKGELDKIRENAPGYGWNELFSENYPHAGGEQHTALYLENAEGFEVEIVAEN